MAHVEVLVVLICVPPIIKQLHTLPAKVLAAYLTRDMCVSSFDHLNRAFTTGAVLGFVSLLPQRKVVIFS